MSGFKFNLKGLEKTIANMDMGVRKVNTESNRALKEGGESMKTIISGNTPVGDGSKGGHAKDNVLVSNVSTEGGSGYKRVRIGYASSHSWYMWFLEEGTYSKGNPKGIAPRKMVEKSMAEGGPIAQEIISTVMAEVISQLGGG